MEHSSTPGIKKKPTFTPVEIRTMLEFIQQTKLVLIESGTPPAQAAIKLRSCVDWTGLAALLSGMGVAERTDVEVRKKFENLLFETKKKFRFRLAGVYTQSEWTEVHEIALELLGRENMMAQISTKSDGSGDGDTKPLNGIQFVSTELSETPPEGSEMQTEMINPDYAEHDRDVENGNIDDQLIDNDEEEDEPKQSPPSVRNGDGHGHGHDHDHEHDHDHNHHDHNHDHDHANSHSPSNDCAQHLVIRSKILAQTQPHVTSITKRPKLESSLNCNTNSGSNTMTVRASPLKMTLRNRLVKPNASNNFRFAVANTNVNAHANTNATSNFSSQSRNSNSGTLLRTSHNSNSTSPLRMRTFALSRNSGSAPSHKRFPTANLMSKYAGVKTGGKSAINGSSVSVARSPSDVTAAELKRSPRLDSDWLSEEHAAKMRVRFLKEQKLTMQIRILKLQEALLRKRLGEPDSHQTLNAQVTDSDDACDVYDADATSPDLVDMRVRV